MADLLVAGFALGGLVLVAWGLPLVGLGPFGAVGTFLSGTVGMAMVWVAYANS